ncbi:MAG: LacI family DNA-binding transcriptional regulator [Paracoccaceae bacterium]
MSDGVHKVAMVTSFDVARKAGVSRSSVSRAFTPGASISPGKRDKIQKAASDLGYRVNLVARGLNKQRTDLVGMIVSGLSNPYRSEQIDALAKQLVREGFRPMLFCIDEGRDVEQLLSILLNYQVSGVVIISDAPPIEICEECARMNVPLALVHRIDNLPFVDRINGDDIKGGRMAAEVLISAGRRYLIAVKQEILGYSGEVRIAAFVDRAAELGVPTDTISSPGGEYAGGMAAAREVAALLDRSPGVFCPSDTVALGLLDTLRNKHSIRIPAQISLIGYDDIPQSSWAFADLTTIKQSVEEFARVTVDVLKERIKNPDAEPKNEIIDVKLVSRGTV